MYIQTLIKAGRLNEQCHFPWKRNATLQVVHGNLRAPVSPSPSPKNVRDY